MNIYAKYGDKVIVTDESIKNGYDCVEEHARKLLEIGKTYTINYTEVDGWTTAVFLVEFPNEEFNSVTFEDYKEK